MRTRAEGSQMTAVGIETFRSIVAVLVYGWSGGAIRGESVGGRSVDVGTGVATSRLNAVVKPPASAASVGPTPPLAARSTPPARIATPRANRVRNTSGAPRRRAEIPRCWRTRRRSGAVALTGWVGRPVDEGRGRTCEAHGSSFAAYR